MGLALEFVRPRVKLYVMMVSLGQDSAIKRGHGLPCGVSGDGFSGSAWARSLLQLGLGMAFQGFRFKCKLGCTTVRLSCVVQRNSGIRLKSRAEDLGVLAGSKGWLLVE